MPPIDDFRFFWAIFASMGWAKQHREQEKWTRFDAFLQVVRRRAYLNASNHCQTGLRIFCDHFAVTLDPVEKPAQGLRKAFGAGQIAWNLSFFQAILTPQKSTMEAMAANASWISWKINTKLRKNNHSLSGYPYSGERFKFKLFSTPKRSKLRQNSKIYLVANIFENKKRNVWRKNRQNRGFLLDVLADKSDSRFRMPRAFYDKTAPNFAPNLVTFLRQ